MRLELKLMLAALGILAACTRATVADIDGNLYPVLRIGRQQWLGANLRTTRAPDGQALTFHYPQNDSTAADRYGLLYDWATAQRACPRDWHLPLDQDWEALRQRLGPAAGAALKDTAGWDAPNAGATNASGFGARASGYWNGGQFDNLFGRIAVFWSATAADSHFIWTRTLASAHDSLRRVPQHPDYGFAVRCLRNR